MTRKQVPEDLDVPCDHLTGYVKKVYENGEICLKYCGKCGEILKKGKKHFKFE